MSGDSFEELFCTAATFIRLDVRLPFNAKVEKLTPLWKALPALENLVQGTKSPSRAFSAKR